jgi:NADPH:quinone reductase-like Zn-dependent oxidoreductase
MLAANSGLVERLGGIAENGKLKISIEKRVAFNEAIAAIAAAKTGQARGKTVIMIGAN